MVTTIDLVRGDTALIIEECRKRGLTRPQCAYVLATAYHETAHKMRPIKEMGGIKYLKAKPYWPWIGRGYVQLTWKENYLFVSKQLGVDFISAPDKALVAEHAVKILVEGMKQGWFVKNGKKLADYINRQQIDYVNARRLVNGKDKAALIAGYAAEYDRLLEATGWYTLMVEMAELPRPIDAVVVDKPTKYNPPSFWNRIRAWFA